jgi:hypothetical protein
MSVLTKAAPHISEVDPNSKEFRAALAAAGLILAGSGLSVYSHHQHYPLGDGEILFEERVMPGELALYPTSEAEAIANGLPSCWAFAPDGSVEVLRYASRELHMGSGIDVTSQQFQAQLAEIGLAFAAAGLHETLEVNISSYLFPHGDETLTIETTDESARTQRVTIGDMPDAVRNGDWSTVACWSFREGVPVVSGACTIGDDTIAHK